MLVAHGENVATRTLDDWAADRTGRLALPDRLSERSPRWLIVLITGASEVRAAW